MLVGDWGFIENYQNNQNPAAPNENIVKVGDDKYWGLWDEGGKVQSFATWEKELKAAYIGGANKGEYGGFSGAGVLFLNVPAIATHQMDRLSKNQ